MQRHSVAHDNPALARNALAGAMTQLCSKSIFLWFVSTSIPRASQTARANRLADREADQRARFTWSLKPMDWCGSRLHPGETHGDHYIRHC